MKKIFILIGFFITIVSYSQGLFTPTDFYVCDKKIEAKRIVKRFGKAVIYKDYTFQENQYYIELEENDINEYFTRIKKHVYCMPKRKIKKILTINMYNDNGVWGDEIILY